MSIMKKTVMFLSCTAFAAQMVNAAPSSSDYSLGTSSGAKNSTLDETYRLDTSGRLCIYQGTLTLNQGAYMKTGGNVNSKCNFVGIENISNPGVLNINGGTLWCSTGNGSGYLAVGSGVNGVKNTSIVTLNSGLLQVDGVLRSSSQWDDKQGTTASGSVIINGGIARIAKIYMGATTVSTGKSSLILNGGTLTANEILFRSGNGQSFTWSNGTLVAGKADIFTLQEYAADNTMTRVLEITGKPASFDTGGFAQTLPAFTGDGSLRLTGGGVVCFSQKELTYGLIFDGAEIDLGLLDAETASLTLPQLEPIGPAVVNVTLPSAPSGRYPLFSCTKTISGSLAHLKIVGGGAGVLVREGNTLYLSFDPEDISGTLVYSDASGGTSTPERTDWARLVFDKTAGQFTVNAENLGISQDIASFSPATQIVEAPLTLSNDITNSIYVASESCLMLNGSVTAKALMKEGEGTLVLASIAEVQSVEPKEGVLDFGGQTFTGDIILDSRHYQGEEIVLTNGTWQPKNYKIVEMQGNTVTIADGFTVKLDKDATSHVAIGMTGLAGMGGFEPQITRLIVDGGTVLAGGNSNSRCNFIGVDAWGEAVLDVRRGLFHATGNSGGYLRVAANKYPYLKGVVRVSGGEFRVDREMSMATMYNGLSAGQGTAVFELSGGVADIGRLYLGANSSDSGRGEIRLTGGVLEVGNLMSLPCCRQTLIADGATIRAKSADTEQAPFLAKLASTDTYAKSYAIGEVGLTIDTAGYAVRCTIPWSGSGGLLICGAGGSLALPSSPAFTGDITIADGAALVFTNSVTCAGKIVFGGAASRLRLDMTRVFTDSIEIETAGFTLPAGVDSILDLVEVIDERYAPDISEDGRSIVLSLTENIVTSAYWTGGGDSTDPLDPANWACTNRFGAAIEDASPMHHTVVFITGTTAFSIPDGETVPWRETIIGNGGAVTLLADCDWSAVPNLTIAAGSFIDLNGHNLKISNLSAVDGGAYVTNSAVGTRPALWTENAFAEQDYINTANVRVDTTCVEVKSVNGVSCTSSHGSLASAMDASVVITGGTTTVTSAGTLGSNGFTANLRVEQDAAVRFNSYIRAGYVDPASDVSIVVTDRASFTTPQYMTIGHHNARPSVFRQNGGTVSTGNDLNIGVGNTATSRYEITSGSLSCANSFVVGRYETTAGFGIFEQSGGTVNANAHLTIGYKEGSSGLYQMKGGELNVPNMEVYVADGNGVDLGVLDLSGGVMNAVNGIALGLTEGATGRLLLRGDARLVTSHVRRNNLSATSSVLCDGGTIEARADNPAFFSKLEDISFGERGLTLDTAGYDLGIDSCVLRPVSGARAITLAGTGSLDLTGAEIRLSRDFTSCDLVVAAEGAITGVPHITNESGRPKGACRVVISPDGKRCSIHRVGMWMTIR